MEGYQKLESAKVEKEDDDEVILPGFRFHPSDEELVGFYLRRKVENKKISIELIKQLDIYKYDPWDLPWASTVVGDSIKERYFFCIRGRKYRNSMRPNRVTGSGFWKATGIDKPVFSTGETADCIGLKKSLVFYRGSAGKGTKTEWMMHEFRLPPVPNHHNATVTQDQAEVWTLCRIFKRTSLNYKRYNSNEELKQPRKNEALAAQEEQRSQFCVISDLENVSMPQSSYSSSITSFWTSPDVDNQHFFTDAKWDELKSVVDLATDPKSLNRGYWCFGAS